MVDNNGSSAEQIKRSVKEKYAKIAARPKIGGCCGTESSCSGGDGIDYSIFADNYSDLQGYNPEADLGLGCGLPTEYARMKAGDTVVDLGSGAGNDAFVARKIVGDTGKVIGIDMTEVMVDLSTKNADKLGYKNVEFVLGDIEEIPLGDAVADVAVSNCVLNLVPNKERAFKEIWRILKPVGHFSISDVVISGNLPETLRQDAEMYAGCVAGAIGKDEYLEIIKSAGFENLTIQQLKEITLPDELLLNVFSKEELSDFRHSATGIYSITVYAEKAA